MSGTDDLVAAAMPWLATEQLDGTAGESWEWWYDGIVDDDGTLVVWTSCTATGKVYDSDGVLILTLTVAFPAAGQIKVTSPPSDTLALNPAGGTPISAHHEIEVTTATSRKFVVVGAGGGTFTIRSKVG